MKKYYVCGFLFSEDYQKVVLIKKSKPEWQKGLLNGVGGKIELIDNSPLDAQIREFKEEAGITVTNWKEFLKLEGDSSIVYFFSATGDVHLAKTMELDKGEEIVVHYLTDFYYAFDGCVPNLSWIIPLALVDDQFTGQINTHYK